MTSIHIAENLALPIDLATQTLLVVGKRGSGKSNTCVRLAEQFFKVKVPFVAIDPTDNWFGLKSSQDGKGPGLGVYIFGGRHGDLPLESTSGQLVADVIVEHRISAVLSVKHFSGREKTRFVSDFMEQLFKRNTEPLHIFMEEAHEIAPQVPFKGEEEMLGRVNRIWKLGRSSGLGGSAITQRPASLSKNITTQAEILIVHRMLGPQDVAAVREWIKYHGESDRVLALLSQLKTGEAWIWAPDFPEGNPIGLRRIKIFYRETFDSSATPKAGEHRREPKNLAPVDLEALRTKMASTIERAKQEDPRELRRQISELRRQFETSKPAMIEKTVEVPVLNDQQIFDLSEAIGKILKVREELTKMGEELSEKIKPLHEALYKFLHRPKLDPDRHLELRPEIKHRLQKSALLPRSSLAPQEAFPQSDPIKLRRGERKMLVVLCRWQPLSLTKAQLATLSGLTVSGGTFSDYYGTLRRGGFLAETGDLVRASEKGRSYFPDAQYPQTTEEIAGIWKSALRRGERAMLDVLIEIHPQSISRQELGERAGLTSNAGTFSDYLGTLRRNGLAEVRGDQVKAGEALFLLK